MSTRAVGVSKLAIGTGEGAPGVGGSLLEEGVGVFILADVLAALRPLLGAGVGVAAGASDFAALAVDLGVAAGLSASLYSDLTLRSFPESIDSEVNSSPKSFALKLGGSFKLCSRFSSTYFEMELWLDPLFSLRALTASTISCSILRLPSSFATLAGGGGGVCAGDTANTLAVEAGVAGFGDEVEPPGDMTLRFRHLSLRSTLERCFSIGESSSSFWMKRHLPGPYRSTPAFKAFSSSSLHLVFGMPFPPLMLSCYYK
mmetsp:Transcript_16990/g.28661  ORF Transcript_16990/g.28661 Transcript_16990/m.28661 type:complete len:258 (+) Transcript_16990:699-1472(+)